MAYATILGRTRVSMFGGASSCGADQQWDPNFVFQGIKGQCTPKGSPMAAVFNANVKALQLALKDLAARGTIPGADPGTADGLMGPRTRSAVLAVIPSIPKLPSAVKTAIEIGAAGAGLSASLTSKLDGLIVSYAPTLTAGIRLMILDQPDLPVTPTTTSTTAPTPARGFFDNFFSPAPGTPWFKTWYGTGGATVAAGLIAYLAFGPGTGEH